MLNDALPVLLAALTTAELDQLREQLIGILARRIAADIAELTDWHAMSSLELSGVIAMIDLRLDRPPITALDIPAAAPAAGPGAPALQSPHEVHHKAPSQARAHHHHAQQIRREHRAG